MADEQTGNEGTDQQGGDQSGGNTPSTGGSEWKAPASQAELNRIIAERVARERDKYKDVDDLRKKAADYDKLVDSQRTEQERILARAEAAEKRAADLEAADAKRRADEETAAQIKTWKAEVSKATGVPESALRGSTKEDLQAHAAEIKALLPDPNTRRAGGAYVPTEGKDPGSGGADPGAEFGRILQNAVRRNAQ